MENRTLKLAFAMGGGVSLGCFSGGALTEAIKQVVWSSIKGGSGYDRVIIDAFSGASAGSLSLAVMLRALLWRTRIEEESAEKTVRREHPDLWEKATHEQKKDLVAAQAAQDLQNRAWVELITLQELLGADDAKRKEEMRYGTGLLDAEAVYRIARQLLLPELQKDVNWDRRLMAPRCLFACTLTSITPFVVDARGSFATTDASLPGLKDALTSQVHKDLRVFDLLFETTINATVAGRMQAQEDEFLTQALEKAPDAKITSAEPITQVPPYPPRWFRLHRGPDAEGAAWDYQSGRAWSTLAATAIASGAFPGAFSPVVLTRYSWEYGWLDKREEGDTLNRASSWPAPLKEARADRQPFAYVDGGVFNNDPVREAFRMVSFLDREESPQQFHRRVLYVDPAVGPDTPSLRAGVLQEYGSGSAKWWNLSSPSAGVRRHTLRRLFGQVGDLIGALLRQGRSREADSVAETKSRFTMRRAFRSAIPGLLKDVSEDNAVELRLQLLAGCKLLLGNWAAGMIPASSGTQVGELLRVVREEVRWNALEGLLKKYVDVGFGKDGVTEDLAEMQLWLEAHLALYFDLALDLDGKQESARLIAITPYTGDPTQPSTLKALKLLGDPVSAFAGFMSEVARKYDFQAGRHCSWLFLKEAHGNQQNPDPIQMYLESEGLKTAPKKTVLLKDQYRRDLLQWIPRLKDRVEQVMADGIRPLPPGPALAFLNWGALFDNLEEDIIEERFSDSFSSWGPVSLELMILTPPGLALEIDGAGIRDADFPVQRVYFHGVYQSALMSEVVHKRRADSGGPWSGGAVKDGNLIHIDRPGLTMGHWAALTLPTEVRWDELRPLIARSLRPVLHIDLSNRAEKGETIRNGEEDWTIKDAAVPLADILLHRP